MAVTVITPEVLKFNTFDADALAMTAPTAAADGFTIDASNIADGKLLLVFLNSSADTAYDVTIKKGNALQGTEDLKQVDVAAEDYALVVPESGKFKNVTGDDKGLIKVIPENAAVKMAAVVLP